MHFPQRLARQKWEKYLLYIHTKWKTTFLEPFNVLFESKSQKPHHFFVVAYKKSVILQ